MMAMEKGVEAAELAILVAWVWIIGGIANQQLGPVAMIWPVYFLAMGIKQLIKDLRQ